MAITESKKTALNSTRRLSNFLVIAPEQSASLELVAGYSFRALEARGVLKLRICTAAEATARDLNWCDVLFAVRPANSAMAVLVLDAKRMDKLVMCHWDDDLLSIPPESSSYAYFSRPGVRKLTLNTLLQADVVLSSSEILIKHLQTLLLRHGRAHVPTHVLPVPALNVKPMLDSSNHIDDESQRALTVGYAGSADQTNSLQNLIVPALEKLWDAGHEIRLELIGPTLQIDSKWQQFVVNTPVTQNYAAWLTLRNSLCWDLALAPLAEGHFYRCKFYNKYIEFAAAGIPCLLSNVAPFNVVVTTEENGVLVNNTVDDWAKAILAMRDPTYRAKIAASAHFKVSQLHDADQVSHKIAAILAPWLTYHAPVKKAVQYVGIRKKIKWVVTNVGRRYW